MFYITSDSYACSALVNIHRLKHNFQTKIRIIALMSSHVSPEYTSALEELNTTVIRREAPPLHEGGAAYYDSCLLKLLVFQMHELVPSVHRVLALDSDQLILQSLDHVFDLPLVDLAAPRAYWLSQPAFMSSTFLLVQPNEHSWARVKREMDTVGRDVYDMDLVNKIFNSTALVLPGSYATLNSHWEDQNIPDWFRPSRQNAVSNSAQPSDNQQVKIGPKGNHTKAQEASIDTGLAELYYEQSHVLHFTAVGKPWSYDMEYPKGNHPKLHPLFHDQWRTWRTTAMEVCPNITFDHV